MKKKFLASMTVSASFLLAMGNANALFVPGGGVVFEDTNFESIGVDTNNNGLLEVGDTLRGIIRIDEIFDTSTGLGQPLGERDLLGVFEAEVTSRAFDSTTGLGDLYDYEFGPSNSFASEFGLNAGSMVALYTDTTDDFGFGAGTGCNSFTACEGIVTSGDPWASFGFAGDDDEYWSTQNPAPENLSVAENFGFSTTLGSFVYAMSLLDNSTGYEFAQVSAPFSTGTGDGLVDVVGSGTIRGTNAFDTIYTTSSDFQFGMNRVPEPASIALLGLGLLFMAGIARRRGLVNRI